MFHFLPQILREYIVTSVVYINGRVGRSEAEIQYFQGVGGFRFTLPTLRLLSPPLNQRHFYQKLI